jgi:hypothetical protein
MTTVLVVGAAVTEVTIVGLRVTYAIEGAIS